MKTTVAAAALAVALCSCSVANAAVFDLTYAGPLFTLDATLDARSVGGGDYLVTRVTGTVTDGGGPEDMTLIRGGPGTFYTPSGAFIVNNVLYDPANPQYFDIYGLAFKASGGEWNLWGNGSNYTLATCVGGCYTFDYGVATASQVSDPAMPEPATWAMLALGFAGLGFVGFRKARPATSIA